MLLKIGNLGPLLRRNNHYFSKVTKFLKYAIVEANPDITDHLGKRLDSGEAFSVTWSVQEC